jgi:hypothetical protein
MKFARRKPGRKINPTQASEYNRLAGIYLRKETDWALRLACWKNGSQI